MEGNSLTTNFFLHAASSTVTGTLPSTAVSTLRRDAVMDAVTVNRSMDTTLGSSQVKLSGTVASGTSPYQVYISRFISKPLNLTSIAANTWTVGFATNASNQTAYWPTDTTLHMISALTVWRPSTGTKVGVIFDSANSSTISSNDNVNVGETTAVINFTGSALTIAVGDVLVFEAFGYTNTTGITLNWYFDGSVQTTADFTTTSNMAAFIQTPQTISFVPPPVSTTVTAKTVTNKVIVKA